MYVPAEERRLVILSYLQPLSSFSVKKKTDHSSMLARPPLRKKTPSRNPKTGSTANTAMIAHIIPAETAEFGVWNVEAK